MAETKKVLEYGGFTWAIKDIIRLRNQKPPKTVGEIETYLIMKYRRSPHQTTLSQLFRRLAKEGKVPKINLSRPKGKLFYEVQKKRLVESRAKRDFVMSIVHPLIKKYYLMYMKAELSSNQGRNATIASAVNNELKNKYGKNRYVINNYRCTPNTVAGFIDRHIDK